MRHFSSCLGRTFDQIDCNFCLLRHSKYFYCGFLLEILVALKVLLKRDLRSFSKGSVINSSGGRGGRHLGGGTKILHTQREGR